MRVDPAVQSNVDRLDLLKMNRLRRVEALPEVGSDGDWVVYKRSDTLADGSVEVCNCTAAWLDGEWVALTEVVVSTTPGATLESGQQELQLGPQTLRLGELTLIAEQEPLDEGLASNYSVLAQGELPLRMGDEELILNELSTD